MSSLFIARTTRWRIRRAIHGRSHTSSSQRPTPIGAVPRIYSREGTHFMHKRTRARTRAHVRTHAGTRTHARTHAHAFTHAHASTHAHARPPARPLVQAPSAGPFSRSLSPPSLLPPGTRQAACRSCVAHDRSRVPHGHACHIMMLVYRLNNKLACHTFTSTTQRSSGVITSAGVMSRRYEPMCSADVISRRDQPT
jgi:hypothetical protein